MTVIIHFILHFFIHISKSTPLSLQVNHCTPFEVNTAPTMTITLEQRVTIRSLTNKQKNSSNLDIISHQCNQPWTRVMSVLVEQRWKGHIAQTTCLILPTTHLLHLAGEHFHSTTTSLVLEDITTNGATDIFIKKQTQKVCRLIYLKETIIATKIEK